MTETTHNSSAAGGDDYEFEAAASFAQQRLWFLDQLEPGSPVYNISLGLKLRGAVDAQALQTAIDGVVARHETLRTTFDAVDDKAVQVIADNVQVRLQREPMPPAPEKRLAALAAEPFDLHTGPLLRAHLLSSDDEQHLLLLVIHHIIADAWSLDVLYRELAAGYAAALQHAVAEFPELPVQYADYAEWQQEWLSGEQLQAQLDYWRNHLNGAPELLELPLDRPRPRVQSHNGAILERRLPASVAAPLKELARNASTTQFVLYLAAFAALLSRYAATDDLVIGTPIAGRKRKELEGLIGFFVNTLGLRIELDGNPDFMTLLERVRKASLGAYAHQDLPFEKLVEELQPTRSTSYSPLFQVMFVLHHATGESQPFAGLDTESLVLDSGTAKFDLTLFVTELRDSTSLLFEYNTDLFDSGTVERMLEHFTTLLRAIAAAPRQQLARLPLLDAAAREQTLKALNDTARDLPLPRVHELVQAQAARTPEAPALEYHGTVLSYAELNARANRLARQLQSLGAGPGKLVAVSMERGPEMALAVLATLKSGAAYVPVDPQYPTERIRGMLDDCAPCVTLTQPGTTAVTVTTDRPVLVADDFAIDGDAADLPAAGDSAYVIYTSGSTGTPKGVELSHAGLSNLILWQSRQPGLDTPARTLQFASLSFDVSFQEMFTTWAQGGCLVLIDEATRRDLPALAKRIAAQRIERLFLPFAALQPLADEFLAAGTLPPLRDVIVAGEQLQITPAIRELFASLGEARLHNHYGPSETHVTTACTLSGRPADWPTLPPIGRPVTNTQAYVLDDNLEPVPAGLPGELWLGGVQVARGYWQRPELTAERFRDDPFAGLLGLPRNRVYRTGDRVRCLADGNLQYLGRTDEQVKWRGFRIEPGEIETVLAQHPSIAQAVVMLREDQPGDRRLVAYVCADGAAPDVAGLRGYLRDRLPDYMVPSVFTVIDTLPLTPSGKLARRALPAPDYASPADNYVAPRNARETELAGIWAEVLGVTRVGVHDDFFDLGGHSLLATQIISRVRDRLGVEVPLLALFEQPTVAGFAAQLPAHGRDAGIAPRMTEGPVPLSFAQQRLWFLEQLEPGNPAYNFPVAIELRGTLDEAAMSRALTALTERHESLRTRFSGSGDHAVQIIAAVQAVPLVPVAGRYAANVLGDKLTALSQQPFDLENGPLLRAHLLQTDRDDTRVLLLVTHHIVSDGWSLNIMLRELAELYRAAAVGDDAPLPPLPVQYADYAVWQRDLLRGHTLQQQLDYWREALADMPPLLDLPTDRPRPAEQSYRGASTLRWLDTDLQAALNKLAAAQSCTLYMVLLATFDVLLATYAGTRDVVVGTPIAGRRRTELEGLIGFLSNTLAIPARLDGDPAFSEFLQAVRRSLLGAYAHQDVPFEKLVEELQPERAMSHSPVFQVMFVLQNNPGGEPDFGADSGTGLAGRTIGFEMGIAKFDLLLEMAESPDGLRMGLQYNSDLFDAATVERMAAHMERLLRAAVRDPSTPLSRLPLMDEHERARVLIDFNNTGFDTDALTLNQLVELQAERSPDTIAVEMGDARLSYRQLNTDANRLARLLRRHGAEPGRFVALCCGRSVATATALLATLKTGAAYVPVDPHYPVERISVMLEDCAPCVVVADAATAATLPDQAATVVRADTDTDAGPDAGRNPDFHDYGDGASAYLIYTSGSTGKPKGVELTHANLSNLVQWQLTQPGLDQPARTLQFASLSFDVSFQELLTTWAQGGTVILVDEDTRRDIPALARFMAAAGVERAFLPYAALQPLAGIIAADDELRFALRDVIVAGEQLQVTPVIRDMFRRLGGTRLHNHYGPSETHVTTAWTSHGTPDDWPALPPIGRPVANTRAYVLDANAEPVPPGIPGELWLGGAQVAKGYLHRPQLTAEKFVADPYSRHAGDRLYRTGDRVRFRPDGNIEYLGRTDDQVKWRGFRIEPGEIETALAALPGVKQAVVMLREDTPGNRQLVAYVTGSAEAPDTATLTTALRATLPDYMVPSVIVALDALPLTPSGKLARRALPVPELAGSAETYIAPRNAIEETLVTLWCDLLGAARVGVRDDFFALGGHSLLATQLISRVRDTLHVDMPLKSLFRHPTPESLATALQAMQMADAMHADDEGDDGDAEEREEFEL